MSAIGGLIYFDKKPVTKELEKMQGALKLYGRDSQKIWKQGHVGLLSTLNRVMAEDAFDRQPWVYHQYHLVADCRIDNRDELIKALDIDPIEAKVMSDSQYILKAYEKWKEECVHHLMGDYAFAVWDAKKEQLFLARDPIGNKPLVWYQKNDLFAFASMPKGLFCLPFIPQEINEDRLLDHIALLPHGDESSFFNHIYRLKPGYYLTVSHDNLKKNKYHSFDLEKRIILKNDQEYLEAFSEKFTKATKDRLRTTGKIASHLSSGFDSSTVTVTAAKLLKQENKSLTAYTAVPQKGFNGLNPKGRHSNEGPLAQKVAQQFDNIHHNLITTDTRKALDTIEKIVFLMDGPVLNFFNMGWITSILDHASEKGHTVLLTGERGNMAISNKGLEALPELFGSGQWLKWFQEMYYLKQKRGWNYKGSIFETVSPYMPIWIYEAILTIFGKEKKWGLESYSGLHPSLLKLAKDRAKAENYDISFRLNKNNRLRRTIILKKGDLGSMYKLHEAMGLERRSPCADLQLFDFCLSLPLNQYLRKGESPFLLKNFMKNTLPDEILNSATRGYQGADWYLSFTQHKEEFEKIFSTFSEKEIFHNLVHTEQIKSSFHDIPNEGWEKKEAIAKYRLALGRNLSRGTFVQVFSDEND